MEVVEKPGWHNRGYHPHFDANSVMQHIVLSGTKGQNLAENPLAALIQEALLCFDGVRYDLQAWCIMPDHVHVALVFYPEFLMNKTIWSRKNWVCREYRMQLSRSVSVFDLDYFDRYVRSLDQAEKLIHYIENNPVKGGLVNLAADWNWSSSRRRHDGWEPKKDKLPIFLPNTSR